MGSVPQPSGHMDDHTFIMELLTTSLGFQIKFLEVHLLKGFSESNGGARDSSCQKRPGLRGMSQSEGSLSTQQCAKHLREVCKSRMLLSKAYMFAYGGPRREIAPCVDRLFA